MCHSQGQSDEHVACYSDISDTVEEKANEPFTVNEVENSSTIEPVS